MAGNKAIKFQVNLYTGITINPFKDGGMVTALAEVDLLRVAANSKLDPASKSSLGQFFTASPTCLYMASLFNDLTGDIRLLDPGCGPGSLTAAFADEVIRRKVATSLTVVSQDVEPAIKPFIEESLSVCQKKFSKKNIQFISKFVLEDFILSDKPLDHEGFTHIIMNPPYKKIASKSPHRVALRTAGIETVNLYTGFIALAIQKLVHGGELVAIIPRSFCNGPYYQPFREFILGETAFHHIHIFESRNHAFSDDDVLQENIILHLVKGGVQGRVKITSSPIADFHIDDETNTITASDKTIRSVSFDNIVNPNDKQKFIHIAANDRDQQVIDRLSSFTETLSELDITVSTGPVVDFRLKSDLRKDIEPDAVPLLYPVHLSGVVEWPKKSKKPNAISVTEKSKPWLWQHKGYFVIVKRFSSKEEKRRISTTYYNSNLPGDFIGFDNKLNVFHRKKIGVDRELAIGLFVYLNSSLLDRYYRLFGGHTQVNATDLRSIHYPDSDTLRRIGRRANDKDISQKHIDGLIEDEIRRMTGNDRSPLSSQERIDQALEILALLGMPRAQQNERSALTFLALLNLHPDGLWSDLEKPLIGVTPIMDWCRDVYGKEYAPNTRETFRRQTLHQFVDGGLSLYNPDKPDRAVNSPKACYQIAPDLLEVLKTFGTTEWEPSVKRWLEHRETLAAQYAMEREMNMIPLTLDGGIEIQLSPGDHSQLIHDIVTEFGPRFAPGSEVIYLGDTGAKEDFFQKGASCRTRRNS